jgi:intracellular multiplication protein IcmD
MSIQANSNKWSWVQAVAIIATPMLLLYAGSSHAEAKDIGAVASTLTGFMANLAKFITATAYVIGIGFGLASFLQFKAHKDNPQATPLGKPMMLLFVAAGMLFLPSIFSVAGGSLGLTAMGGVTGVVS